MRRISGWALTVLGALLALLGLALVVYLGPDGRRTTGPHAVETDHSVVVTAPRVIRWADVQIDVLTEVPAQKPVFVGLGNTVDVEDFVGRVQRIEITEFRAPWNPTVVDREGELPTVQAAPTALDWWISSSAGLGGASISTTLPNEPVSLAIVSIGSSDLSGLEVSLAYGVRGGFGKGIGLLLAGIGVVLAGRIVRRGEPLLEEDQVGDDEEVVYVYVDDEGIEHELSADELDDDVVVIDETEEVEEVEEVDETDETDVPADPGPEPEQDTEAEPEQDTEAESKPELEPELEPEPEPEPEPVYVWIDDDGVEHELTEAEVAELGDDVEIVDDEGEEGR